MDLTFEKSSKMSRSGLWVAGGAVAILILVVLLLAARNYQRGMQSSQRLLLAKGDSLIRSIEAGTRAGVLRMRWGQGQLQHLLEETSLQPDIRFIAIVNPSGRILGHSKAKEVGKRWVIPLGTLQRNGLQVVEATDGDGVKTLLMWREFRPLKPQGMEGRMGGHMGMMHGGHQQSSDESCIYPGEKRKPFIVLGLDPSTYEVARARDFQGSLVISGLLLLLGVGGIVSLFWFQSYRSARESLRDTSAMAQEVVSSLPVGLMVVDRGGAVVFMNAAAEEISGLKGSESRGAQAATVLPDLMARVDASLDAGGALQEEEQYCLFPNGRKVPVSISASSIVNEEGEHLGRVVILRDLREVKRLEKELRHKETLAAIGDMAAGVAHEIRNPLSSIKGIATYFRGLFDDAHDAREAAGVMIDEVDRLNRAVTELLTIAGPTRLVTARHDVSEIVGRSLRLVEAEAQTLGVILTVKGPEAPLFAVLDADRLTQSLLNLFLNALQAMPEGGGSLDVALAPCDNGFRLTITDSGCGMDAATVKSMFDPYYTTKADGTGLGLAIVHKIVEAHGGSIDVTSRPGEGTQFLMTFPEVIPGERCDE